jgi:hypothetical protein
LYLFVLPALWFRFFPFILTHNSTPLSAYLALVLVFIPAKVALSAREAFTFVAKTSNDEQRSDSPLPLCWTNAAKPGCCRPSKRSPRNIKSRQVVSALRILPWLCGTACTLWAYTAGLSSPFPTADAVISSSPTLQAQQMRNATYYISATFWNNEDMLDAWTVETLRLIDVLGRHNVYISMAENDSFDDTVTKLLRFSDILTERNVMHNLNITTGLREEPLQDPWRSVSHRMGYMTNLRNGGLELLGRLHRRFDNVVLLNDVVYHHTDVLKLIAAVGDDDDDDDDDHDITTGQGSLDIHQRQKRRRKRRMACGLDMDGATLYDTWVLQDKWGQPVSGFWPFFHSAKDKELVSAGRVVQVGTCWNGMAVLDGDMFIDASLRSTNADWDADALRFQEPPSDCVISECSYLPLTITNTTGGFPIVLDPTVVVAYSLKWWKYYAVWLRMPIVRLWMRVFEERYWALWWNVGMGEGLRWTGLDGGDEKECAIEGWPTCDNTYGTRKGDIRFKDGRVSL